MLCAMEAKKIIEIIEITAIIEIFHACLIKKLRIKGLSTFNPQRF